MPKKSINETFNLVEPDYNKTMLTEEEALKYFNLIREKILDYDLGFGISLTYSRAQSISKFGDNSKNQLNIHGDVITSKQVELRDSRLDVWREMGDLRHLAGYEVAPCLKELKNYDYF